MDKESICVCLKKLLGITADTEVCRHALKILYEKLLKERG